MGLLHSSLFMAGWREGGGRVVISPVMRTQTCRWCLMFRTESTRISQRRPQFYLLKAFTLSVLAVHSPGLLCTWYWDAWDKTIPLHYGFLKCESCRRGFIQREDSSLWREGQRWFQSVVYCTLHFKHSQTLLTCPIDWVVILLLNSYWSHTHTAHSGCSQFTHNLTWAGRGKVTQINAYPPSLGHGHGRIG